MTGSSEYLAVLKASYDYSPQSTDEVEIKEDQLVFLVERTDDEWWKIKVKQDGADDSGPMGLVPASYLEDATAISVVKALYDYDATAPGELTIKEDEELDVYDKEDEWILVKKKTEDRVGYVPANYCDLDGDEETAADSPAAASPPASNYVDPAERVAALSSANSKADPIQTWAVSEVDAKNKKKKGTLGVGQGSIFFASESDKTPVQKWETKDIASVKTEKSKHIHIDIGGSKAASLHFHAGSKEVEAIVKKLEESKALSSTLSPPTSPAPERARSPPATVHAAPPPPLAVDIPQERPKASVHFSNSPASIIPPPEEVEGSEAGDDAAEEEGEAGAALYDFAADGEDELSVREGEKLRVLDRTNEEWWKCRNVYGAEGVVPASYVEFAAGVDAGAAATGGDEDQDDEAAREAELVAQREAEELEEQRLEQERVDQERKKKEDAERKAKAAAAAAAARQKAADDRAAREQREKEKHDAEEQEKREADERRADEKAKRRQREKEEAEQRAKASRERPTSNGASVGASSSKQASRDKDRERRKPDQSNVRTWHDRTGQFQVDAEFLGFNNGLLRLHKTNGVVIEVPSEKMSAEDMQYIDNYRRKKEREREQREQRRPSDEDDVPLGTLQRKATTTSKPEQKALPQQPKKKGRQVDWFDFFLSAGCDIDDCTRYAASFERDKIDEAILPDIKESTLRSLGLREGDIIRVAKVIDQRKAASGNRPEVKEQVIRDEELARHLQAQEDAGIRSSPAPGNVKRNNTTSPAPNLFAGPDGVLKAPRRGRPEKGKTAPPSIVSRDSIASEPDRTESPVAPPPRVSTSPSPVVPPKTVGGFDDDAWTVRPSKSPAPPLAASAASPPAAPPAPTPPPPPPAPAAPALATAQPTSAAPARPVSTNPTPTTQDPNTFDILSKIAAYRPPSAPAPASQSFASSPSPSIVTPPGFQSGLGMGSSPLSMGQHLQAQQTGFIPNLNAPRGPLAPVPTNQSLLQPLLPTTTGFNGFVPTRPASNPLSFQPTGSPFQTSPFQNPSAFTSQPIMSQHTGYPMSSSPLQFQATGMPQGGLNGFGSSSGFSASPFGGGVQTNPTGYNPAFSQGFQAPPPIPSLPQSASPANAAPANIFAQMKAGTFASDDDNGPQSANKYDALRPPTGLAPQPTGWGQMNGYQTNGFQTYGFQPR